MFGYDNPIDYIQYRMNPGEILVCLAEEAAELSQAALKLRRALGHGSPTPVQPAEALAGLYEEVADVLVCLDVWGVQVLTPHRQVDKITDEKLQRWADRLKEVEKNGISEQSQP